MFEKEKNALSSSFYQREDVTQIAQELLGKWLFSSIDGVIVGGIITETESYKGAEDRACHAYNNRKTKRTAVMFEDGGIAYVYMCYGIHFLLNVVTHRKGTPHAVLIRAIAPTVGIKHMLKRRKKKKLDQALTSGPGTLTQALGISKAHNGISLSSDTLWIEDRKMHISQDQIIASKRVGVDYAGEDALKPWNFAIDFQLEIGNL